MTYIDPVLPLLLIAAGWSIARGARGIWRRLGLAAIVLLFLWAWPPLAWLTSVTLEGHYPATAFPAREADAIVVLSGSIYPPSPSQPEAALGQDTSLRCQHAAWLYRNWRPLPVFVSGGPGDAGTPAAAAMRAFLESAGVPRERIEVEAGSSSTYQNALFTARMLLARRLRRVALVTEGYHMLRSELSFRKQGIDVVPAPCCYYTQAFQLKWSTLLPRGAAVTINSRNLHEWIGLAWYRISGQI